MYYVTLQHGSAFPHEIERLWCTVATVKRNVIPILEFLISRGLQEMNAQVLDTCIYKVLLISLGGTPVIVLLSGKRNPCCDPS